MQQSSRSNAVDESSRTKMPFLFLSCNIIFDFQAIFDCSVGDRLASTIREQHSLIHECMADDDVRYVRRSIATIIGELVTYVFKHASMQSTNPLPTT